jgi:hypothetical protein
MNKRIFIAAILFFTMFNAFAERYVLISRIRLNGDGSGKYDDVTREENNIYGMNGEVEGTKVSIGCVNPGLKTCPLFRASNGGPVTDVDESVSNYIEQRMRDVEVIISNGTLNSNSTFIVSILLSNGQSQLYRIYENWTFTDIYNGTIELKVEKYNGN